MNDNKKSRKEWVKTAAIIFLSVMLVLTFFSNTIMNYSLPEVATQYIQPGSITAQIRGTGVVESGDPYKVKVSGIRKVESIEVTVGDRVQKGDILMYLSYKDSDALKAAKAELEAAELSYEMALLTGQVDVSVMQNAGSTLSSDAYKNKIISLKSQIELAEKEVKAAQAKVDDLTRWGEALNTQLSITATYTDTELNDAEASVAHKKAVWESIHSVSGGDAANAAKAEYDAAVQEFENMKYSNDTAASLKGQGETNKVNLFHASNELSDKQKVLAEKEQALNDYVKNTSDAIDLGTKYQAVVDARKKVEEMESEMTGTKVTAPISGTISAINVTSGLDTPQDGIVANMQPEGEGYTMSFSVTNEQARKVNVGEQASLVNSWRYDDLKLTLTRIMPDKNNPSQQKMLVFDVEGEDVIAGQSLNVSVGQKSANYDMLVPNSAVREDNNGKFILIVESKNSPLGNRYIATRIDVEVIASDDTKSAITGGVYGYEFVITTSTQPVQAGQYVRLSDN